MASRAGVRPARRRQAPPPAWPPLLAGPPPVGPPRPSRGGAWMRACWRRASAGAASGVSVIEGRVNAGPVEAVVPDGPARSAGAGGEVAHPASSASAAPAVSHSPSSLPIDLRSFSALLLQFSGGYGFAQRGANLELDATFGFATGRLRGLRALGNLRVGGPRRFARCGLGDGTLALVGLGCHRRIGEQAPARAWRRIAARRR